MFKDIKVIEYKDLPEKLKSVRPIIEKLFYIGNIEILKENAIAIVGTRHPTEYGKRWSKYFAKEITHYDVCIVSGLAIRHR
ncbi:MAG: DNA-protecting protein DprA [Clostridia bacterium]|nr:DNA-protecting protein DprA [Clostridia bacterium]